MNGEENKQQLRDRTRKNPTVDLTTKIYATHKIN